MSEHTKGPWSLVVDVQGHPTSYRVKDANGDNVCVPCYGHDPRGITEANARLIAAAPDLLAELRNIANAVPSAWDKDVRDQFRQWAQNRARAAIAKAEAE